MASVELKRVGYAYPGTGKVLTDVDLSIFSGQATVIFGASGSGKSTLAYLFNGLIPHFFGGRLEGTVIVEGFDTRRTTVCDLFPQVGLVIQNADAQLFNATVMEELAFGLESLGLSPAAIDGRIRETASELGIGHLLNRSPETLSGGEKRLSAVAAVLCTDPAVVVLDEPFAGLDWASSHTLTNFLIRIPRNGKKLILIEHRARPFLQAADRCLVVNRGRIQYDGAPQAAAAMLAEQHLIPQYPVRTGARRGPDGEPVLTVRNLSCCMAHRHVLDDISLDIRKGEALAIVGENGAGKTTLVKHCTGLLTPVSGEVLFKGRPIRNFEPRERAACIGICFQNPNDQFFRTDVRRELMNGPERLGRSDPVWQQRIVDALQLAPLFDRSPYRLSEGEKRRVALASILLMRPEILFLDEPTTGQDGSCKEALIEIIGLVAESGTITVVVTHDLDFAEASADRWLWLQNGELRADGASKVVRRKLETDFCVHPQGS